MTAGEGVGDVLFCAQRSDVKNPVSNRKMAMTRIIV
jgi:hypothetical protein